MEFLFTHTFRVIMAFAMVIMVNGIIVVEIFGDRWKNPGATIAVPGTFVQVMTLIGNIVMIGYLASLA